MARQVLLMLSTSLLGNRVQFSLNRMCVSASEFGSAGALYDLQISGGSWHTKNKKKHKKVVKKTAHFHSINSSRAGECWSAWWVVCRFVHYINIFSINFSSFFFLLGIRCFGTFSNEFVDERWIFCWSEAVALVASTSLWSFHSARRLFFLVRFSQPVWSENECDMWMLYSLAILVYISVHGFWWWWR